MTATPRRLLKSVTSLSVAALLLGSLTASPAAAQPEAPSIDALPAEVTVPASALEAPAVDQPDRFIVKFMDKAQPSAAGREKVYELTVEDLGIPVEELRPTGDGAVVLEAVESLTEDQVQEVVTALEARSDVEYAEVDHFATLMAAPDDLMYPFQWSLFEAQGGMRVEQAWNTSTGSGITVAVIDTGSTNHSDLTANTVSGYDFISDPNVSGDGNGRDPDPTDAGDACGTNRSSWHGTHVAGTVAATANNNSGVAGVAYGAKLQHVRVMGTCGGWTSDIIPGIIWAAGGTISGVPNNPNPAQVINLSLGTAAACGTSYQNAIDYAVSRGVVVVAAAGNAGSPVAGTSPADCKNVITVGATGREGAQTPYSNYGLEVDVSAPGGDMSRGYEGGILSTYNQGSTTQGSEGYNYLQGTSMATPHVAGAAALMLSAKRSLTPADVEKILKDTTRPLPGACFGGCGTGIVDANAAVKAVAPQAPTLTGAVPTITGSPRVESTLTAVPGTWGPSPVNLTYQWLHNGDAIPNATASTLKLDVGVTGGKVSVKVTGTKTGYTSASKTSAQTAVITDPNDDIITPVPVITNASSAQVGVQLTTTIGTWAPAPVTLTYQWLRDGTLISGATQTTYTPVAADVGRTLTIKVTGTGSIPSTSSTSTPTRAVLLGVLSPAQPTISGAAAVGYTLTAASSGWAPGTSVGYQWLRDGQPINRGTGVNYQVIPADNGKRLSVRATGSKDGYAPATITSGQTNVIHQKFSDVPDYLQFSEYIYWMAGEGISTGWTEKDGTKTYRPLVSVNRDAMAAFMYRMAGSPAYAPPAKSPFADISTSQQFYKEMAWLASTGVSTGWTERNGTKTYRALEPVNRDAMAAFMYRLAGKPAFTPPAKSPFADVSTKQQFYKEITWLASTGISTGWPDGTYRALTPVKRDAMAAFMNRYSQKF
ncbi:S8 family serine peptidase [Arthrobacter sp. CAN_C5]|uniref:S8 family serine peptidase n=1 Tax=Arthrobacter sp. CAN_C5 TaxID=2760706 RepID=UPI001FDA3475|nr:S8 family serine peptidase [Arthrobacter sp. CAN_C5]MBP2216012.1 serine protease [Arthrobacter sp. CAN_C5]